MRIPVVGVGAVASIGNTADEIYRNLCDGISGISSMRGFDPALYTAGRLYEIDDRSSEGDSIGRATTFLMSAVEQALAGAGVADARGVPILVGTGLRELRSVELWARGDAPADLLDLGFTAALQNRFDATEVHTFANACSASLYALALGVDLIESGESDMVVVAGTDSITESMFAVADRLQSVPPSALQPFDRNRRGTILGEGAAAVVLRREVGGEVHGYIRSVAVNCDAHHATAPNRASIMSAMREAHARAHVRPDDIDLLMLHGTGTPANDLAEAIAVEEVFTSRLPTMTAIKSMTGHTSGASGLHSLIASLAVLEKGVVPPIVSILEVMDEAAQFGLTSEPKSIEGMRLAQINAFGFGGVNAVAVVEAP